MGDFCPDSYSFNSSDWEMEVRYATLYTVLAPQETSFLLVSLQSFFNNRCLPYAICNGFLD